MPRPLSTVVTGWYTSKSLLKLSKMGLALAGAMWGPYTEWGMAPNSSGARIVQLRGARSCW